MALIKIEGKANIQGKTIFDAGPDGYSVTDANAISYIAAVEAADKTALEDPVKQAIENFIVGCKSDGIWTALKASCILAGARTLNGALVPLVGTAPTNNNFVSGDYNRKTGLKGNGSTKYLITNRANNSDPQNNAHFSIFRQESLGTGIRGAFGSFKNTAPVFYRGFLFNSASENFARCNNSVATASYGNGASLGFYGVARSSSTVQKNKFPGIAVQSVSSTSGPPTGYVDYVFANNGNNTQVQHYYNARLSFYSIGESLDLAALDTRVSNLMTALAAAI